MPIDYLNKSDRKTVIAEIVESEENRRRKEESLMSYEIFKGAQGKYILSKIQQELGADAAKNSRTITSINLTQKMVREQAALYRTSPERTFSDLNEKQLDHVMKLYASAKADVKFKKTNEIFKLLDQGALQVVLSEGKICFRPLYLHHYDVIPKYSNPEVAECYIVSSFDKGRSMTGLQTGNGSQYSFLQKGYFSDSVNQKIGDPDDYRSNKLYYWWTDELNFITNGHGDYVDQDGQRIIQLDADIINPIGKMPFVDVALDKDYEFFVRSGNNKSQFSLDLGALLSDVAEIARLQGFSQAVISSVEEPKDLRVGPRRLVWLKLNPNDSDATRPSFEFTSPSPDLSASLQLISDYLSLFLTSQGLSPKVVNTRGEKESFSSGVDRFLSMIDKFDSSQDDMSLFESVEDEVYELIKLWNNTYYTATENGFNSDLAGVAIPETSEVSVNFVKPQMLMSDVEKIDMIQKRLEMGLISLPEAVAEDRNIEVEEAVKILSQISIEEVIEQDGGIETDTKGSQSKFGDKS